MFMFHYQCSYLQVPPLAHQNNNRKKVYVGSKDLLLLEIHYLFCLLPFIFSHSIAVLWNLNVHTDCQYFHHF